MSTINVADKAIANAALTEVLMNGIEEATGDPNATTAILLADYLITQASKVRFQPSTRQLVLTFDLAFNSSEPDTSGPVQ